MCLKSTNKVIVFLFLLFAICAVDPNKGVNAKEGQQKISAYDVNLFLKRFEKALNSEDIGTVEYFIRQNVPASSLFVQKQPVQVNGWTVFAPNSYTDLERNRFLQHLIYKKRSVPDYTINLNPYDRFGLEGHYIGLVRTSLEEVTTQQRRTSFGSVYSEEVTISRSICEMFLSKENDHVQLTHMTCRPQNRNSYMF